ncbi:MAG: endonuclease III, partial [Thermotogaceae bacterium]|nr:endonuclease III [Thermotogaceae bacterium]
IARILVQKYGGRVPDNLEELVKLPGVGRKTANIVLAVSYHRPALAVDTHVHRISNRIGLVKTKSPLQTEKQLTKIVPENLWAQINGPMVEFGRTVCLPRKPRCKICPLAGECGYYKNLSTQK